MKTALITGVTGQDGAYLTRRLLDLGYRVKATYRRSSTPNLWRLEELGVAEHPELELLEFDVTDFSAGLRLIDYCQPAEVYNLAAQSFVQVSFQQPMTTAMISGMGPVNLLEALRTINPKTRFYQASSAEMFGEVRAIPQTEETPFNPRSPYAAAKLYAHTMTVIYREAYGLFATSGILFNHESPLRGPEFVTRKITLAVARIKLGLQKTLLLGNLDAIRDWGFAPEYVEGMRLMLQEDTPDTYLLATNRTSTVREFASMSFQAAGIELIWQGKGDQEEGTCAETGRTLVRIDPRLYRPAEVELLIGNPAKANAQLGWSASMPLEELSRIMVEADLRREERLAATRSHERRP